MLWLMRWLKAYSRKKIHEWKEQIENQQLLVRDIIDIDSTYEDFESLDENEELKSNKKQKAKKDQVEENKKDPEQQETNEDDEFNVSLAKMEEEIKPKIINILDSLNKNYLKLKKYQVENRMYFSIKRTFVSKNKNFKKYRRFW